MILIFADQSARRDEPPLPLFIDPLAIAQYRLFFTQSLMNQFLLLTAAEDHNVALIYKLPYFIRLFIRADHPRPTARAFSPSHCTAFLFHRLRLHKPIAVSKLFI